MAVQINEWTNMELNEHITIGLSYNILCVLQAQVKPWMTTTLQHTKWLHYYQGYFILQADKQLLSTSYDPVLTSSHCVSKYMYITQQTPKTTALPTIQLCTSTNELWLLICHTVHQSIHHEVQQIQSTEYATYVRQLDQKKIVIQVIYKGVIRKYSQTPYEIYK